MYFNHIILEALDTLYVCGWLSVNEGGMLTDRGGGKYSNQNPSHELLHL